MDSDADTLYDRVAALEAEVQGLRRVTQALRTFHVGGTPYHYHSSHANRTWDNERAVELPLARHELSNARRGAAILEVGNVLQHYFPCSHRVIDKYERGDRIDNVDILDVEFGEPLDLILSVSTLEHVGKDLGRPELAVEAVKRLASVLTRTGTFFFTVPVGYNRPLDHFLASPELTNAEFRYLRRVTRENDWVEADSWPQIAASAYGKPFPAANAVVVGWIRH